MRDVVRQKVRGRRWARLATQDLVVAGLAVVVLALVTADVMAGGLLTSLDETTRNATFPSGGSPEWTHAVGLLGNVGVGSTAALVAALVTMHARQLWWPGVLVVSQLAVTGMLVVGLKYLVARPGPATTSLDGYPGFYPSGHTATAMVSVGALAFVLSDWRGSSTRRARGWGLVSGSAAGVLVAASTVFGGFHWLSDALASLALGVGVLVVGFSVVQHWAEPSR